MTDARGRARSFIDLLPEIADSFSRLSKAESLGLGQKLGLDIGTIMLLQKGRREVEAVIKRQKELGFVTKEDTIIAAKFNNALKESDHVFRTLYTRIGSFILPQLTKFLKLTEEIAKGVQKHSVVIKGAIIGIGTAISVSLLPPLIRAAAAVVVATYPFLLLVGVITAVSAAIALLVDDWQHFKKGNDSVIGDIVGKWPIVGTILEKIIGTVKIAVDFIKEFIYALALLFINPVKAFQILVDALKNGIRELLNLFPSIGAAYDKIKSLVGGDTSKLVIEGQHKLSAAQFSPLNSRSSSSILNSSKSLTRNTSVSVGNINIQTQATDAAGIAKEVGKSLSTQISQTMNDVDDGVAA